MQYSCSLLLAFSTLKNSSGIDIYNWLTSERPGGTVWFARGRRFGSPKTSSTTILSTECDPRGGAVVFDS